MEQSLREGIGHGNDPALNNTLNSQQLKCSEITDLLLVPTFACLSDCMCFETTEHTQKHSVISLNEGLFPLKDT